MKIKTGGEIKALFGKLSGGIRSVYARANHLRARYFSLRRVLLYAGIGTGVLIVSYTAQFYWSRSITFSYAGSNCFINPILLPRLTKSKPSSSYDATMPASVSIGSYPIYSHRTCIKATRAPISGKTETVQLRELRSSFFKKNIRVLPRKAPALISTTTFDKPLPSKEPLKLSLESADQVYAYQISANDKSADCTEQGSELTCNMDQLELTQSTKYELILERMFEGKKAGEALKKQITTIEPINVASSTVTAGQTVYNVPTEISVTFDKSIKSFSGTRLELISGDVRGKIPGSFTSSDKTLTFRFTEPLARSASFILTLDNVTSPDGSTLSTPLILPFVTSGGPKVLGASIGSYKAATTGSITLSFDATLDAAQSANEFIHLEIGGSVVAATITKKGKTLTIKPVSPLPRCTAFTIKVLDGIKNEAGISGGSAWQFKSRTICQTVFSIGTSTQGRGITAYSFGSGPSKIIFVGALHGNEKSSTYLLNRWIDALEAGADRIPSNRTIIVIPNSNPDGYAVDQRTNANNVDLNRNFPANDWKTGVTMPDGSYLEHGGGTTALSEPESQAVANYILSQGPRLVMSYHASGAIASPNESGDSQAIAITYAQKSTVGYLNSGSTGSFFDYDTTGSMENWLHDKYSIPSIIVELTTKTGNEYSGHQNALWYVAQLP